jgi:hypothetical protein
MADIFISYSKADRDKVALLAAYLESEGWTVWWDTNLAAGDTFRDEIMTQLARARAVIVLWTTHSIRSDFVRAEAGRAKADGKLIPVKESDVSYGDIPLPFGEMHGRHRSSIGQAGVATDRVLAGRQATQISCPGMVRRSRRSAHTIWQDEGFAGFHGSGPLIVTHWEAWTATFWRWAFALVGIKIPTELAPALTFATFCLSIAVGARSQYPSAENTRSNSRPSPASSRLLFQVYAIEFAVIALIALHLTWNMSRTVEDASRWEVVVLLLLAAGSALYLFVGSEGMSMSTASFLVMITIFFYVLFVVPSANIFTRFTSGAPLDSSGQYLAVALMVAIAFYLPRLMVRICPLPAIVKRLEAVTVILFFLIALNWASFHAPAIKSLLARPA